MSFSRIPDRGLLMSSEFAVEVENLSKNYHIYEKPSDRLKQILFPPLARMAGLSGKQYYSEHRAVDSVSFSIPRGHTVGIIGRNGSGKSTLLQMICGTLAPSSGRVESTGRIAALLELGAGFSPDFTGRENVKMNCSILGMSAQEIDERFEAIEAFADIGKFIDQPVKTYSSGMYVRLAFAVAINADPDILVIDEALAVGDEAFQRKCFGRIEQIKKNGATILFVSHGSQTILQLCDRAILMDRGQAILDGVPSTVVKQYQRLIGARGDRVEDIRKSILKQSDDADAESSKPALGASVKSVPAAAPSMDHAWFDESVPKPVTAEVGGERAQIRNVRFETDDGVHVNVLTSGQKYKYKYEVFVSEPIESMGFGMLVKAINGIELGGVGTTLRQDSINVTEAPSVVEVQMEFYCMLAPALYYANAGCGFIDSNGEPQVLHRILDAACFRVVGADRIEFSSNVDFGIGYTINVIRPDTSDLGASTTSLNP